jgi:hypothetical protein
MSGIPASNFKNGSLPMKGSSLDRGISRERQVYHQVLSIGLAFLSKLLTQIKADASYLDHPEGGF